ncbi:MAG: STAS domain-containing protein [Acidobacteria bacterium]|nr:STAS domain-containing protein [Acidobacteriota bacterium]
MDITRTTGENGLELGVAGRLDGYWADHLDNVLADAVRDGHHRLRLDLSQVAFLSSAGIAVLVKFYKQLTAIGGSLVVVRPSATVQTVLQITRLASLLAGGDAPTPEAAAALDPVRRIERHGAGIESFELDAAATLACCVIGDHEPLRAGGFDERQCTSMDARSPVFALGVGAFGTSFADCRSRFGELISVEGATAYQPADGTNVPDYLVSAGALSPDVHLLYGLSCEGRFSRLVRFEPLTPGGTIGLASVLESCLHVAAAPALGVVIVAEAAGLVGATLRQSPASPHGEADFFDHPGLRRRLTFTAERAFPRSLVLAAGIVAIGKAAQRIPQLRPIGVDGCAGHLHAAAFPFRPVRKGRIDLRDTVASLFEGEQLLGVLHLLHDDRGATGAGESEFNRGACWIGPIDPASMAG